MSTQSPDHVTVSILHAPHPTLDAEVIMECGAWVVHRRINHGTLSVVGWTVTHRTTGMALWTVLHYQDALRVCQWADAHSAIPADKAGCIAWQGSTSRVEKTRLMEKLHIVAPRFVAP